MKAAAVLALIGAAVSAGAAPPFTPARDDEVVERLPLRPAAADERARRRAEQRALAQRPQDLPQALTLAREAIERSRRHGDPRELGTAQAWLQPWWSDPAAPPAVRLLKATLLQARHEFDAAFAELDRLLAERGLAPALRAQAELTRASLLQLRGRWDEARAGCERLAAPPLSLPHGQACLIELDSLQGRGPEPARRFTQLASQPGAPLAWIALLQAELAQRRGDPAAGALYARATQLGGDLYGRAAHADWLLDQGRAAEALAVAGAGQPAELAMWPDALLLRAAIAWKRLDSPQAAQAAAEMQGRLAAAALRGDDSHARERARFALDVQGDAALALGQATLNWAQQREPADALLLLRAARAAGRPQAAEPVRAFMRERSMQDRRLQQEAG